MVDFDTLLSHYDERLTRSLDRKYLEQEWGFSKVQHGSAQMPRDILPVDPAYRQRQASAREMSLNVLPRLRALLLI